MLKLLFIAHSFHKKTKSNLFFAEILKKHFEVTELYLGPERYDLDTQLFDVDVDYVVVWQLDYLAPIFINKGLRTLVVPMYDGSSLLPQEHWQLSQGARFLSFSLNIHQNIIEAGCESLLVKYFPECSNSVVKDYSSLRAFWWMRLTNGPLDIKSILKRWGASLDSLHIHLVPDNPNTNIEKIKSTIYQILSDLKKESSDLKVKITLSEWFESEKEMLSVLDRSNVYIAPRASEGIGMGFLKAMSKGMIILAHDKPTHNEYIAHGVNGYLFTQAQEETLDLKLKGALIGNLAKVTCERGRKKWLETEEELVNFARSIPKPEVHKGYLKKDDFSYLLNNYFKGTSQYLLALRKIMQEMNLIPTPEKKEGEIIVSNLKPQPSACRIYKSYGFGNREAKRFMLSGWSPSEGLKKNWITGKGASLFLSLPQVAQDKSLILEIFARTSRINAQIDKKPLKIFVDHDCIAELLLQESYETYTVKIPKRFLFSKAPVLLSFECESLANHKNFETKVSCALESFKFMEEYSFDERETYLHGYMQSNFTKEKSSLFRKIRNLI